MHIAKFEFALKTDNSFGMPDFKGSTFRGTFGHVLKRSICLMQHRQCDACELRGKCAYPYLFETSSNDGQSVPRPFVIEPPLSHQRFYLKDEMMYLNLILVGRAIDYLSYFVHVFSRMGREGIGRDRGRYHIESIKCFDLSGEKRLVYEPANGWLNKQFLRIDLDTLHATVQPQVTLRFLTPTQLQKKGTVQEFPDFELLLKSILRRFNSLRYFHGDGGKERFEINWNLAKEIETFYREGSLVELKRYSNRQKRPVLHRGYLGKVCYRGDLTSFVPWLQIGELLHIGKGTVFGMGKYTIA